MTVSKELLLAILAMDSYNRGYDAGLVLDGDRVGLAKVALTSTDPGANVPGGQSSGFFASSYTLMSAVAGMNAADTVISYRGTSTSTVWATLLDGITRWSVGAGINTAAQAQQAIAFYNAASGHNISDGTQSTVTLTGHSLGGGLAGYISALTGDQAVGFDHMPFGLAAAIEHADYPATTKLTFSNFTGINTEGLRGYGDGAHN